MWRRAHVKSKSSPHTVTIQPPPLTLVSLCVTVRASCIVRGCSEIDNSTMRACEIGSLKWCSLGFDKEHGACKCTWTPQCAFVHVRKDGILGALMTSVVAILLLSIWSSVDSKGLNCQAGGMFVRINMGMAAGNLSVDGPRSAGSRFELTRQRGVSSLRRCGGALTTGRCTYA